MVRLCDCRWLQAEGDPVCDTTQVLPDCRHRQLGVCFGQPELSGGASSWHKHCSIPQAAFADQPTPHFSEARRGRSWVSRSHGSRHGGNRAGHPVWPCWHRPCRPIPACVFASLTMVSNPGLSARSCGASTLVRTSSAPIRVRHEPRKTGPSNHP